MIHCLEYQGYMETVCYPCAEWGECQSSNIEDCMRRDRDELEVAAEKRDLAAREYDLAWERVKQEADRVGEIMKSGGG